MDRLIDVKTVCSQVGIGKTKLWEMVTAKEFPAPYTFGRCTRWSENEVQQWIHSLKAGEEWAA